jgi:hypothetical protein
MKRSYFIDFLVEGTDKDILKIDVLPEYMAEDMKIRTRR